MTLCVESRAAAAILSSERDAQQKLGLVLIARQAAVRVEEVLGAPSRVAHFGGDADEQRLDTNAGPEHESARGAVTQFYRVSRAASAGYVVDRVRDGLLHSAERVPGDPAIHIWVDDLARQPVLQQKGELPGVARGFGTLKNTAGAGDEAASRVTEVPVENVGFDADPEWQPEFRSRADNVAIRITAVVEMAALCGAQKVVHREPTSQTEREGLGKGRSGPEQKQEQEQEQWSHDLRYGPCGLTVPIVREAHVRLHTSEDWNVASRARALLTA